MTPHTSLRTLHDIEPMITIEGLPALHRTSRFAEVEIRREGRCFLLSLPLTRDAMRYTEQVLQPLQRIRHSAWASIEVLSGELRWTDACDKEHRCDLVLQALPGSPVSEGIAPYTTAERSAMFDRLEAALDELGIAHNNLKAENLRIDNGRLIPIRWFDLTTDGNRERDRRALTQLREEFGCSACDALICSDFEASYTAMTDEPTHATNHFSEGLCRRRQGAMTGYVDRKGGFIIPPQFLQAGAFFENRAVVCTETGWGVIDREGRYVIAPHYDRIDYRTASSCFVVYQGDLRAQFNYLGEQQTEFTPEGCTLAIG